ncbi:MAG: YigZ family protein [Oscillospiraceae bacterium]|jgi:uncharacterized YigZ family protein|nr:YigZ family protein [Oscillospiraceae bacterium]
MTNNGFFTPTREAEFELREKRSRFIARVFPVADARRAAELTESVRAKHRAARHNAWAYVLADGAARHSDDGEPQGTAGAAAAEHLARGNIRGILVVVTRYFGGVLLGTGGLSRAYSGAAKGAVELSGLALALPKTRLAVRCDYAAAGIVGAEITRLRGVTESSRYTEDVEITAYFGEADAAAFSERVTELSAGKIKPETLGEILVYSEEK